jgi:hypothetical protein
MNKLPIISGKECIEVLENAGFYIKRRESSHVILRRDYPFSYNCCSGSQGDRSGPLEGHHQAGGAFCR